MESDVKHPGILSLTLSIANNRTACMYSYIYIYIVNYTFVCILAITIFFLSLCSIASRQPKCEDALHICSLQGYLSS